MYNFYQTKLWTDLSEKVYEKKMFKETLFWQEYIWIIKEKKIWPVTTRWYQILWVIVPDDMEVVKKEARRLKKKYNNKFGNILFQLWIINPMVQFANIAHRSKAFKDDMKNMRLSIREWVRHGSWLKPSFKENMPEANIVYDITKSDEQLLDEMNSWCKERVKKSMRKWATFRVADPSEYEKFYKDWKHLAWNKWFNIIPYDLYIKLVTYITKNDCGNVFIAEIDDHMLAWSICIYDKHRIIYLYGFASREKEYRNIGAHHFLKFKIFGWGRAKWLTYCDMLGGAPTGFDNHPWAGVSKFKESLWWFKVEHYGNFDIILNSPLYKLFEWKQKRRKAKREKMIMLKKKKAKEQNAKKKKSRK